MHTPGGWQVHLTGKVSQEHRMGFSDDWRPWYEALAKPSWTPAPATIGMIWQVLYPIILVTFGFVLVQAFRGRIPWRVLLPFAVNLAANLAFTPLMFDLRNISLATLDILLVWGTIVWIMVTIWPYYRWVALAQLPYLVWVSIATTVQVSIWWGN
jgi:tryptophan-rich sensory protein